MGFKENFKDELSYKGMSSKELSNITGISQGSISNYLKEKSSIPSADVAVKIAKALNVSVEYLVTGKESQCQLKRYSPEVKQVSEKLEKLSEHDKKIIVTLINTLIQEYN